MKGLLLTACAMLLLGASYAQDNDADDDKITNERVGHDGSPMPGGGHHHDMTHWNHLTTLALSPLQYTENGVGLGLSYERALDADGIISLYLPAMATFNLKRDNYNYYDPYTSYPGGYYPSGNSGNASVMFYFMPGVKFYPTGMGRVKYAIGPSAVVGVGQKAMYTDRYMYDPYGGTYPAYSYGVQDRLLFGMMINNSLNINATPHLYIGAEMGFGFTYYDKVGNYNRGVTFLTQGAFKMGYTF